MQSILSFEQLSSSFSDYFSIFFIMPNPSIPRPIKAKIIMNEAELSIHEGWNKHQCKLCSKFCSGGAGSGWTNFLNHLSHSHAIGGMRKSRRDFLIEKFNPTLGATILDHFSYPVEIQTIHLFLSCCDEKSSTSML